MKFRLPGATAIAAALVAMAAAAPLAIAPAHAQPGGQGTISVSKPLVGPLNEARNAVIAKDWPTAKAKLDAASPLAKTPVDNGQIERLRLVMAAETNDGAQQVKSINALIASGTLTPDEVKQYKGALGKAHELAGDAAASLAADRAFVDQYDGSADQLILVADKLSKAGDNGAATTYAEKAIAKASAANGKAPESWLKLLRRVANSAGDTAKFYTVTEQLLVDYPNEAYWRDLIARAQKEPNYGYGAKLDIFRALQAAGVKLSPQEISVAADEALKRGLPSETVSILEPAGVTSEFDTKNLASAKTLAASDKAGLAKETADVLKKGAGSDIASVGEALLSYGDNAKAVEVLQAALAKGIADPGEAALVKLHLGIAQFRAGDKDAARATWADVKADNGAGVLARNWDLISKIK